MTESGNSNSLENGNKENSKMLSENSEKTLSYDNIETISSNEEERISPYSFHEERGLNKEEDNTITSPYINEETVTHTPKKIAASVKEETKAVSRPHKLKQPESPRLPDFQKRENHFASFLLEEKIIDRHDLLLGLYKTAQDQGTSLFQVIFESGNMLMSDFYKKVAYWLNCKYFESADEILSLVEFPLGRDHAVFLRSQTLPIVPAWEKGGSNGAINLVSSNPFDLNMYDFISQHLKGYPLIWHFGNPTALKNVVQRLSVTASALKDVKEEPLKIIEFTDENEEFLSLNIQEADVPTMINWFIYRAVKGRASDVHIEPGERYMSVRVRIDGVLQEEYMLPMELHPEVTSRIKILSEMNVAEKRLPQDGRFGVRISGNSIDLRVSTFPTVRGEKVVLRLLEQSALHFSLDSIGFQVGDLERLKKRIAAPYGMIIISGPTGSGKTTTLYSAINSLDVSRLNVVTVEDPVEYRLTGVYQLQVKEKIGLTFASSLRSILRQDPDVILVGEIRDSETAEIAVRAALTGHIVLSTLHTNDAVGVMARLLDMGIEPFLLASAMSIAMAQRLVRVICEMCRETISGKKVVRELQKKGVTKKQLNDLKIEIDVDNQYEAGRGCSHCRETGYYGRRAVLELFEVDEEIKMAMLERPFNEPKIRELAKAQGMISLKDNGLLLVEEGVTTIEEVIRLLVEL